uniref:Uncharacterized protein n=1 Tax=Corethron hystrix TaxID=216773 RepID=A0A7S1BZR3_9STRA|mmetsp:Transcript_8404/g.18434  ORF Transcript_8404/g.18434 Transcript_8404/m.18434 type:complete len:551 (+) Transcript_8404:203-1855(+)
MSFSQKVTAMSRTMTFVTPKFVKIVDWRLAALNYFLSLVIVVYVLLQIFMSKNFLETEVPLGHFTSWARIEPDYYSSQSETKIPCSNLTNYTFMFDERDSFKDVRCAFLSGDELITKTPTGDLFIATHLEEKITFRSPEPDGGCASNITFTDGDEPVDLSPDRFKGFEGRPGLCSYEKKVNWLTVGAEQVKIFIRHEASAEKVSKRKVPNPRTIIQGPDGTVFSTFEGRIELSLAKILEIAKVDLDKRFADHYNYNTQDPDPNLGIGPDKKRTPIARLSGVRISMALKYYNHGLDDKSFKNIAIGPKTPYAILEINPSFSWTSLGQKLTYRSNRESLDDPITMKDGVPDGYMLTMYPRGISIDISTSGIVGSFSFSYLLNQIITGLVLLGTASTICTMVAKYMLGTKSKIYSRMMQEEVNVDRDAAKYALQGMLATKQYRKLEMIDGVEGITLDELHQEIKKAFCGDVVENKTGSSGPNLSDHECLILAMYIMRVADDEAKERFLKGLPNLTVSEMGDGRSINLSEWTEIMTGDVIDNEMLKEIIKGEND